MSDSMYKLRLQSYNWETDRKPIKGLESRSESCIHVYIACRLLILDFHCILDHNITKHYWSSILASGLWYRFLINSLRLASSPHYLRNQYYSDMLASMTDRSIDRGYRESVAASRLLIPVQGFFLAAAPIESWSHRRELTVLVAARVSLMRSLRNICRESYIARSSNASKMRLLNHLAEAFHPPKKKE